MKIFQLKHFNLKNHQQDITSIEKIFQRNDSNCSISNLKFILNFIIYFTWNLFKIEIHLKFIKSEKRDFIHLKFILKIDHLFHLRFILKFMIYFKFGIYFIRI